MEIREYFSSDKKELWTAQMKICGWRPGEWLGELLEDGEFQDVVGRGALVAMLTDGDKLVSFCTLAPRDEIWPTELTPWIGLYETYGYDFLHIHRDEDGEEARVYVKALQVDSKEKELRMAKGSRWKEAIVAAAKKELDLTAICGS